MRRSLDVASPDGDTFGRSGVRLLSGFTKGCVVIMQIRIKSIPPGEAPEDVRQAWIGLVIPVPPRFTGRRTGFATGVLSGPKSRLGALLAIVFGRARRSEGYMVESKVAVDLLAVRSPAAADWWRQHAPRFIEPGRYFMFATDSCEELP